MSYTGGCDQDTRGQASLDRSAMESEKIYDSSAYQAYSATIHCPNGDDSNCSRQETVQPFLGKYSE